MSRYRIIRQLRAQRRLLAPKPGMIIVQSALMWTILMGLVGAGVDYGVLVIENTRIQHAIDAASLAAARSLVSGNSPGTTAAQNTANSYLQSMGYQNGVDGVTVSMSFSSSMGTALMQSVANPFFDLNLAVALQLVDGGARAKMVDRYHQTYDFLSDPHDRRIHVTQLCDSALFMSAAVEPGLAT